MSSPFKTFEEFNQAEGAIYTFANSPAVIAVFLILTVLIVFYFIYKSYTIRSTSHSGNPAALSVLILTSAISLASSIQSHLMPSSPSQRQTQIESTARSRPYALLGMIGLSSTLGSTVRRRSRFRSTRSRRSRQQF